MNQILTTPSPVANPRLAAALQALRNGQGVLVSDNPDRENEADIIFAAEPLTEPQMATLIRECSGIVCLCLTDEKVRSLDLPQMAEENSSHYGTAFTVTIEAATGVTTGVSAHDRLQTVRAAIADGAKPSDLNRPGHVFPLRARPGGVLERGGHTEAAVDLARLAGWKPCGVLCELMNPDGTMAKGEQIVAFSKKHGLPMISVTEIIEYRRESGF